MGGGGWANGGGPLPDGHLPVALGGGIGGQRSEAALALLAGARALPAQEATAAVRGVVTDTAGTPIPYALVRILRATSEQFTGAHGRFAAAGLVPGTYRIQVRQVGFEPFDSTVSVSASAAVLRVV